MIIEPVAVAAGILLRPTTRADAGATLRAFERNREHLRPWDPRRAEDFYTLAEQTLRLTDRLAQYAAGQTVPWVLAEGDEIVGMATLTNVVLGPFRSANLGYWIDVDHVGRGLASAVVAEVCRLADERLDLHRLQAGTAPGNAASQRVLARCGFEKFGTAPYYLHINGRWQDSVLFQRILNDREPGENQ